MIIVTTDTIPGKNIVEVIGYLSVGTVIGSEIHSYTKMQEESRKITAGRLIEKAQKEGANAIIGLRLTSSSIMSSTSGMVAYGTAVKIEE